MPSRRSEERRVGKECRYRCDWSSDVCSSDLNYADQGREKMTSLISVKNLSVSFHLGKAHTVDAVKDVSFDVPANSTVALVGESGSGESVSAMSIVRLLPENAF